MNSLALSKSYIFWLLLAFSGIGGLIISFHFLPEAFPIVHLDITMDRAEILSSAANLAKKYNLYPKDFQQAALFSIDELEKTYIELEGGGTKELIAILEEKFYQPYTWKVRHFKENESSESKLYFAPNGTPYGFSEKLAEDTPGAALTAQEAQTIAKQAATQHWQIDFSQFTFIEASQETKPNGRVDHNFAYELVGKKVGEASYRLNLRISGEKFTKLKISLKIPEAFLQRYENMRSLNNMLAAIATFIAYLLFALGGVFALFYFARNGWVIWKTPFIWASIIGLLLTLNVLCQFPISWFKYDTALAKPTVYLNLILSLFTTFSFTICFFGFIFAAAETVSRKAFPHHIQFWKLWTLQGAATWQTLGRTLGGYFYAGIDFTFTILLYFFASRYLGWWTPVSSLTDPNILATYFPWFGCIAQSLQAGFFEESLFRAIPLSLAALIGKRTGKLRFCLITGLIIQAIIFGAAHANYPAQPAYARLIELIFPSFIYGGIFIYFGLLPVIICHSMYNLIWSAIPIFVASTPGIWLDQVAIVIVGLVPLWIAISARLRLGKWSNIPRSFYNAAWQPYKLEKEKYIHKNGMLVYLKNKDRKKLLFAGVLGFFCWVFFQKFNQDAKPLPITKQEAVIIADNFIKNNNIHLSEPWKTLTKVDATPNYVDRFIWQANRNLYQKLLGTFLLPPRWFVRYAKFEGDLISRAEQYYVNIGPDGKIIRFYHQIPESMPGKELSQEEARTIAQNALKHLYTIDPKDISEISAIAHKHETRKDWIFSYSVSDVFPEKTEKSMQGEAHITIEINGDQLAGFKQSIFVPQEWKRSNRQKQENLNILKMLCSLMLLLLLLGGTIKSIIRWSRYQFATKIFFVFFSVFFIKSLIQIINLWPSLITYFKTSEPYFHQVWILVSPLFLHAFFKALFYGLVATYVSSTYFTIFIRSNLAQRIKMSIGVGGIILGVDAIIHRIYLYFSSKPLWAEYAHTAAYVPALSMALTMLTGFISLTLIFFLVFKIIDHCTNGGKQKILLGLLLSLAFGTLMHGGAGIENIYIWLLGGSILGLTIFILYQFAIRFDQGLIPLAGGSYMIGEALYQGAFKAYPGSQLGTILSILLVSVFALWWSNQMENIAE